MKNRYAIFLLGIMLSGCWKKTTKPADIQLTTDTDPLSAFINLTELNLDVDNKYKE